MKNVVSKLSDNALLKAHDFHLSRGRDSAPILRIIDDELERRGWDMQEFDELTPDDFKDYISSYIY